MAIRLKLSINTGQDQSNNCVFHTDVENKNKLLQEVVNEDDYLSTVEVGSYVDLLNGQTADEKQTLQV